MVELAVAAQTMTMAARAVRRVRPAVPATAAAAPVMTWMRIYLFVRSFADDQRAIRPRDIVAGHLRHEEVRHRPHHAPRRSPPVGAGARPDQRMVSADRCLRGLRRRCDLSRVHVDGCW